MFGEPYNNSGNNAEFKPASPSARQPRGGHHASTSAAAGAKSGGARHMENTPGSPAVPAAVSLVAALSGRGPINAFNSSSHTSNAAPNALREDSDAYARGGGEGGSGGTRLKSVAEIIKELDEDQNIAGPKAGCCSRLFIPFLIAILLFVLLLATVWTSGSGVDVAAAPRVAVIIIEGFKGTAFDEMVRYGHHLPNIAALMGLRGGVFAACPTASAATCARSVVVENDATGTVGVFSGSSIASILTGVSPRQHGVTDDSLDAYATYATTSNQFPSLAKRVKDAGRRVTVMGTAHLLNSFGAGTGRCTMPGVLDMECAATKDVVIADVTDPFNPDATTLECLSGATCNANLRKIKSPTNPSEYSDGHAETQFTRQLKEIFGGLELREPHQESAAQNIVADILDDSLFVFHFDSLAVRTQSEALPDFTYSAASDSYVAQAYLIDAMVGQILAFVHDRTRTQKENWLVLGLSDHGGSGKSFSHPAATSSSAELNADQVIAFFMSTYTTNAKEYVRLKPLGTATSQLDVLPTVLRWLSIAPFDDETQLAVEGKNESSSAEVEAKLAARKVFEGQVRGICTSGLSPVDCV